MNMSRLSFASIFKLLNKEFGTHSKDDGESLLESLNKEKEVEEEIAIMNRTQISSVSTQIQRVIMMNVNSLANLKKPS